jgi:serine/threonine protein kinase
VFRLRLFFTLTLSLSLSLSLALFGALSRRSVARLLRAVPAPLLDTAACVRVAKSVARACRFLHHALPAPVVHGDLTVANVLLTDEGVAKLCDFGLSRTQHQVDSNWWPQRRAEKTGANRLVCSLLLTIVFTDC